MLPAFFFFGTLRLVIFCGLTCWLYLKSQSYIIMSEVNKSHIDFF